MMKGKRLIAILMCAVILAGTCTVDGMAAEAAGFGNFIETNQYVDGMFTDVSAGEWYYDNVKTAYGLGLMVGDDGYFDPAANVTVAQTVTIASRLHSIYTTGQDDFQQGSPWYQVYVDYAVEHQILQKGYGDYEIPATRGEFAQILAASLPEEALAAQNTVLDDTLPDVRLSDPWGAAVYKLYRAGIVTGSDSQGTFHPDTPIQRCEVAAIVTRMAAPALRKEFTGAASPDEPAAGAVSPNESALLTVGDASYFIGMEETSLRDLAGAPDETLDAAAGYVWYIYGTDTYKDFFMAGVYEGQVVALCASGPGFSYKGYTMGSTGVKEVSDDTVRVSLYTDSNDGDILHCVLLTSRTADFSENAGNDSTRLYNESKVDYHLVNAFRVYHSLPALKWSEQAATSAHLHSQDMADNNYFDHTSLDGRQPWTRMKAQGISYHAAAENISAGRNNGIDTHDGWVNSSGHRSNILNDDVTRLGVGAAYQQNSTYRYYFTENFYGE